MIQKIADAQDEDYDWKVSIVDLMKLLKLDSSLRAQEARARTRLSGQAHWVAGNEHLATQACHAEARRERRCGT